jgi:hypothetical protein
MFLAVAVFVTFLGCEVAAVADEQSSRLNGRVMGAGQPLAGVLVSDGRRVVATDRYGSYELPIDGESGRFVFVTLPRGYWSENFYLPLETAIEQDSVDFNLCRMMQSNRFDFVFLADMHLEQRDIDGAKLIASIAEINKMTPQPAFLLFQGDICLQSGAGDLYTECLATSDVPVRHGAGNHEMMLGHKNPRDNFEQRFGPTYYSFDWGPLHCIVLDGNEPIAGEKGWQAVHGAVEGRELQWLEADLAAQPKGKPIVVGVHIPIVSSYPFRRSTSPQNAPYWEMTNRELLTGLLARYGVRLVLQGHMHENERTTIDGVEYVSSISISGSWWKAGKGFERGVDNCPRGYRIVSVDGGAVTHRYQSSAESRVTRPGEFYGVDRPIPAGSETVFVFNCYDAPNEATAEARIDDESWQPMPAFAAPSPATKGLTMAHHYRLIADTTGMDAGRHTIAVRVKYPNEEIVEASSSFTIVETHRE